MYDLDNTIAAMDALVGYSKYENPAYDFWTLKARLNLLRINNLTGEAFLKILDEYTEICSAFFSSRCTAYSYSFGVG